MLKWRWKWNILLLITKHDICRKQESIWSNRWILVLDNLLNGTHWYQDFEIRGIEQFSWQILKITKVSISKIISHGLYWLFFNKSSRFCACADFKNFNRVYFTTIHYYRRLFARNLEGMVWLVVGGAPDWVNLVGPGETLPLIRARLSSLLAWRAS